MAEQLRIEWVSDVAAIVARRPAIKGLADARGIDWKGESGPSLNVDAHERLSEDSCCGVGDFPRRGLDGA